MKVCAAVLFLVLAGAVPSSFAGVALVTGPSGLSGSDFLNIGTAIGGEGTTETSGFSATTTDSNSVVFSDTGTNGFSVLQEGDLWSGNFANNAFVLWTGNINTGNPDAVPVTLTFGSLIAGVGMQIDTDPYGAFTASITAFGTGGVNLGSFTENGNATGANDNSAIFIGVLSSSANIKSITINITAPTPEPDYAIGSLTFGAASSSVPEPSTLALFLGAAGLLSSVKAFKRRR